MKLISKIFWLLTIGVLVYGGFFIYENWNSWMNPAEGPNIYNNKIEPADNLQSYINNEYKFQIKYPADFSREKALSIAPVEQGNMQYNFSFPVVNSKMVFNLSNQEYKNTGFKYAYLSVVVYDDKNSVLACESYLPEKTSQNNKVAVEIDGREFYRYDWSDNAMGGQRGIGYIYFGSYNDKCIMMNGFLNYRDERGFKDNNPLYLEDQVIQKILSKLNSIAVTLKSI